MSCEKLPDALQQQLQASKEEQKLEPKDSASQQKIEKIQTLIKQKKMRTGKMDCAIVMDLTQSMDPYIEKMQLELCNLIADIEIQNKELDIRFGFVGYKDFCDDPEVQLEQSTQILSNSKQKQPLEFKKLVTGHLSILDFSSNLENFQKFLMKQYAEGGGDIPEDVAGALQQSLKLSWRTDSFKIVVLVSDSPTHGEQYQNPMLLDDYPKGHPFGIRLEDVITTYAKMGVMFLLFKITDSTEKMYQIIKQEMKLRQAKIRTIDLRKALKREQFKKKENKEKLKFEKAKEAENKKKELAKKAKKKRLDSYEIEDSEDEEDDDSSDSKSEHVSTPIYYDSEEKNKLRRPASFINLKIAEKINFDSDCSNLSAEEEID